MVTFGKLNRDGTLSNVRQMNQETFRHCPFTIFDFDHYRTDGSCKCSNAKERAKLIKECGYIKKSFKKIPLVD